MHRRLITFLALGSVLVASCRPDLPTTPPAAPYSPPYSSLVQSQAVGQGNCGELDNYAFTTPSGDAAGSVTTYWDDYSIYGVFTAAPGFRFLRTTFGVIEWINIPYGIPFGANGKVDFERFILQSRNDPPAELVTQRVPMDLINEELMVYAILPRAVMRREGRTMPPMWAGEEIPWPDDIAWHSDSAARYAAIYMIPNCRPRVTILTDLNMFDNDGLPGNMLLAGQLIWTVEEPWSKRWDYPQFDPSGAALFDRGRDSPCWRDGSCGDNALSALRTLYTGLVGGGLSDIFSRAGTLTSIPSGVKLLFLWLPREVFTVAEINGLKQFIATGGRIVFVTDRPDYYGTAGRRTLNQFLADMGSGARAASGAFDCGDYHDVPLRALPPHRLTQSIGSVRVRCSGAITAALRDFILFRDASGEHVTGASVSVNTTPILEHHKVAVD